MVKTSKKLGKCAMCVMKKYKSIGFKILKRVYKTSLNVAQFSLEG